ncbi:MAG: ABC transporter permease [Candidatus Delongbacteria bacterium]|nr:ABC transporter permease [Candidatus Delongbacteria bacterium]MBN2833823.1 ABC transporter permease [Candidatus Delongbacteria bacterium]
MFNRFSTSVFIAIDSLKSNIVRSFLTTLGIIFGVGAVIAMTSIGEGAKEEIIAQIKQLGMDNIIISIDNSDESNQQKGTLTFRDLYNLNESFKENRITGVVKFNPRCFINSKYQNNDVLAVNSDYFSINSLFPAKGFFFTEDNENSYDKVCVITTSLSRNLFAMESSIGKKIKIGNEWFTIIGEAEIEALKKSDKVDMSAMDNRDKSIFIPLQTYQKRFSANATLTSIIFNTGDENKVLPYSKILKRKMATLHNNKEDFKLLVPQELLAQSQNTQNIFNLVMGTIASISLLVGGIGIMNIMLANALERRKEIGIRRAIGATRKDILFQFIFEASLISFLGGVIGIFLGIIMTYFISKYAEWGTSINALSILAAFVVSVSVGLIFGILPARKAADMNPIDALRYE